MFMSPPILDRLSHRAPHRARLVSMPLGRCGATILFRTFHDLPQDSRSLARQSAAARLTGNEAVMWSRSAPMPSRKAVATKPCLIVQRSPADERPPRPRRQFLNTQLPSGRGVSAWRPSASNFSIRWRRGAPAALRRANWRRRSEQCSCLMVAARGGESQIFRQSLSELGICLRGKTTGRVCPRLDQRLPAGARRRWRRAAFPMSTSVATRPWI